MAEYDGTVVLDLVNVHDTPKGKGSSIVTTLAWGDTVRVLGKSGGALKVRLDLLTTGTRRATVSERIGYIRAPAKKSRLTLEDVIAAANGGSGVLKVDFIDVQQGDAAVVETPSGKVLLIDGGDNQLFARYLASRFSGTSLAQPQPIECIVVTHGDADHFAGLTAIHASEKYRGTSPAEERSKRLFIQPKRIYHNGLVKRPGKLDGKRLRDDDMFGDTAASNGRLHVTGLVDDVAEFDPAKMNKPFKAWRAALRTWRKRADVEIRRLARPIDGEPADAFAFLADDGVDVDILGPLEHRVNRKPALPFLGTPVPRPDRQPDDRREIATGRSASHTINGHSIVLRLRYGRCRILFAGDLNEESEAFLTTAHQQQAVDLTAEIFKVPHHGSADFSVPFLQAVSPVVSVISSGDESEQKEYIHPRATLVGALSKQGRASVAEPLIFVTELAAFFKLEGWVVNNSRAIKHRTQKCERKGEWFAFSRKAFGTVKVRTDGNRMLVYTYSGKDDMKEAYAFTLDGGGSVTPDAVRKC